MTFNWLKRYLPKGIYGRAALILLVPIITLQVVVSVVFIQRHYEDVTRLMTRSLVFDLRLMQSEATNAPDMATAQARVAELGRKLDFEVALPAPPAPAEDLRRFYDLSGRVVLEVLRAQLMGTDRIDLISGRFRVGVWMTTAHGELWVGLSRSRVAASNPHQFLVLMLFVGLVMTIVAFIFLRNQMRPIKRLAAAAEAFGKGQRVPYRLAGAAEVRSAGMAFLEMRARIERQIEQRTMMLSGVSHDLRTPLTRMKLALAMIEDREAVALLRDVEEMEHLLDEFLAFARDDSLDDPVEMDPQEIVNAALAKFGRCGAALSAGPVEGAGRVTLRPVAVGRALDNLIGNALRYGKHATLGLRVTDRSVQFTVEDDGPGIPETQREEALKPFARLDQARNQDKGSGVGLGLAIANDIARSHGGRLSLSSSERLGGLRVDLTLPR